MQTIRLFHVTGEEGAKGILAEGFRSRACREFEAGVFVSNTPLSPMEGTAGSVVLEVLFESTPEEMFNEFEIQEADKPYREFLIPAERLNRHPVRRLTEEEADILLHDASAEFWNEYPPGEPETTWAELRIEDQRLAEDPEYDL